ncbi:Beta-lactamase-like protein 2 [Dinochytrium kinnereticum]|nr:Beta-lactamase-like protein 2 [Dinochytrium kinnereticum]
MRVLDALHHHPRTCRSSHSHYASPSAASNRLFSTTSYIRIRLATSTNIHATQPLPTTVQTLTPRVTRISVAPYGPFSRDASNAYLIGSGRHRILIDTGNGNPLFAEAVVSALVSRKVEKVTRVLLTHSHLGHVGGLSVLEKVAWDWARVKRLMSTGSERGGLESMLEAAKAAALASVAAGKNVVRDTATLANEIIGKHSVGATEERSGSQLWISKIMSKGDRAGVAQRSADGTPTGLTFLKEGEVIRVPGDGVNGNDSTLEVIWTPGHAEDHAAFYLREEMALFSGDCISSTSCPSSLYNEAAGSYVVYEDLRAYLTTLEKLVKRIDAPRVIYPGHGDVIVDGLGAIQNAIDAQKAFSDRILQEIAKGARKGIPIETSEIISHILLAPKSSAVSGDRTLAVRGAVKLHLLDLEHRGRIRRRHLSETEDQDGGAFGKEAESLKGPGGLTMKQVFSAVKDSRRKDWAEDKDAGIGKEKKKEAKRWTRERQHTVHQDVELGNEVAWAPT